MKTNILKSVLLLVVILVGTVSVSAQIKYYSDGKVAINSEPFKSYSITAGNCGGLYMKCLTSNFFQIDCSPAATRLASHYDQVVFFNTQTGKYNSIQVKNVYNYSDARAKTNVKPLNGLMPKLMQLKTYSYNFIDEASKNASEPFVKGGNGNDYGLLAQEVEQIFPELVLTDPDGNKLINYTELIPMMLNAIQELNAKVIKLEAGK